MTKQKLFQILVLIWIINMPAVAQDDEYNFHEKLTFYEDIRTNISPEFVSLLELKYLKNLLECKKLVLARNIVVDDTQYDAYLDQYPDYFYITFISNRKSVKSEDLVLATCEFNKKTNKGLVGIGDQYLPGWSKNTERLLKRK